jgi:hypothetical protein
VTVEPAAGLGAFLPESVALPGSPLGVVWTTIASVLGWLLGVLGGWAIVSALLGAAIVLDLLGSRDVYTRLRRAVDRTDRASVEAVREMSPEAMTDDAGRFSSDAFERATGMTPAEFVRLFVKREGGRAKQGTLAACLPWSRSTVSRLLDTLEDEGVVERIEVGREKVVYTAEAAPDGRSGVDPPG